MIAFCVNLEYLQNNCILQDPFLQCKSSCGLTDGMATCSNQRAEDVELWLSRAGFVLKRLTLFCWVFLLLRIPHFK